MIPTLVSSLTPSSVLTGLMIITVDVNLASEGKIVQMVLRTVTVFPVNMVARVLPHQQVTNVHVPQVGMVTSVKAV